MLQLLKPENVEPVLLDKRSHHDEKPEPQLEKARAKQ